VAEGEWSASFAVFTDSSEKLLVHWMPSLFGVFGTEQEAEQVARSAGLRFIENLK